MPGHPGRSGCRRSAAGCQPRGDQTTRRLALPISRNRAGRWQKLGGWDKLKDAAAIEAELANGQIMDLLRVNSGDGSTEDGYVLAERMMQGGQGF